MTPSPLPRLHAPLAVVLLAALLSGWPAVGANQDVEEPVTILRAYLASDDPHERASAVARLAAHRDYRPGKLSGWLHRAWAYPDTRPGTMIIDVPVAEGDTRRVIVVVPDGYRADRAWPLIYALHPSGTKGLDWARQVRTMLGARAREFVIAAPDGYRQNYIAAKPPFSAEHPAILDAVARAVHVDSDRVYAFGYSKGGFAAWFVALYYPDRFAGAISFASGFDVTVDEGGFWKQVVGNIAHVPVYNAWGERDTLVARGLDGEPDGTFAEQNRRFADAVLRMGLPITNVEVPGGVHNALSPPPGPMLTVLAGRRASDPRRVSHTFRHLHQASSYWLEGLGWTGDRWGEQPPALLPASDGESPRQVLARTLEPLLGRLEGSIDGQTIRVTRRHIGEFVVWIGDKTIDWDRAVRVEVEGTVAFEGPVARDPAIALARAAATMDFDRLRWAGIRVDAAGAGHVVTFERVPGPAWRAETEP